MVPPILYYTIHEIDRRGMAVRSLTIEVYASFVWLLLYRCFQEVGLYRIPGMVRSVRELKDKFLKGKTPDMSKVRCVDMLSGPYDLEGVTNFDILLIFMM